jgi:hypothetical protein
VIEFELAEACVSLDSYQLKFRKMMKLDIKKAGKAIEGIGEIFGQTNVLVLAKVDDAAVSLYGDGRIIIKNLRKEDASKLGRKIVDRLEAVGALS